MKKIIAFFSLMILAKIGFACSCEPYEPDFFKNISAETYNCIAVFDRMDYSYEFDGVQGQTGYFILVDTIGSFGSKIGDTIIVTGQDGFNCGEMLNGFSRGDTMFLALSNGFYETFEKDTFYLEGVCGKHYLEITDGQNNGLSISEIKDKINSKITAIKKWNIEKQLTLYPNPGNEQITIESDAALLESLKVYDVTGSLVRSVDNINSLTYEVDLTNLETGIYNILINTKNGQISKKLVKE